ncbi:MAG: HAD-IA family hydrolase [Bacteroidales bacterium]|nr:HAD-IA family hydrolase [Bacteroidales bacterium]
MPSPTSLLILDFDGTLADTRRNIVMTLQQVMRQLGYPVADDDACAATIGIPLRDAFLRLIPQATKADADLCTSTYRQFFEANRRQLVPQLFPHVRETLELLRLRGIQMAIASSRTSTSLSAFLDDMDIAPYFQLVVGAQEVSQPKPSPMPVLHILHKLHLTPGQALVVGDMPVDILMGAGAGTRTCGVTYGNGIPADLLAAGADCLIDDFADLLPLIVS